MASTTRSNRPTHPPGYHGVQATNVRIGGPRRDEGQPAPRAEIPSIDPSKIATVKLTKSPPSVLPAANSRNKKNVFYEYSSKVDFGKYPVDIFFPCLRLKLTNNINSIGVVIVRTEET